MKVIPHRGLKGRERAAGIGQAVVLSRPFKPRAGRAPADPGNRPSPSSLGWTLPARWAGHSRPAARSPACLAARSLD